MNWIFQSAQRDATYILGPLLLGTLYCLFVGEYHIAWFGLVVHCIDQTHVVSTSWRTFLYKKQKKIINYSVPVSVFIVVFILGYLNSANLWAIITYLGIVHMIRQNYGVLRWYHKINNYFDRYEPHLFYFFSITPFALVHFKEGIIINLFENGTFFHYPAQIIFERGMNVYVGLVALWFFYEAFIRKNLMQSLGSKVFILGNSLFTYIALTTLTTNAQIADTFLFAHGLHYLSLNLLSIKKTQRPKPRVYAMIFLAGLVLIALYLKIPSPLFNVTEGIEEPTILIAFLGALYHLPVLSHYTYDTFIWRSSDVDAKKIYQSSS